VTHLLSAAAPNVAERIYRARLPNVRIGQKLTGYLDEKTVARIDRLGREHPERDIDIGYRAWHAEPWLGEHGQFKVQIAERTVEAAKEMPKLRIDISTAEDAVLLGDDWLRFLLRCRTVLGAEGGASVLDRDGTIRERTRAYLAETNPGATFEETRQACFAQEDGGLDLFCIGPRHLEACATGTCQILVEGGYQGILRKDFDYIAVKRDFSNLGDVLRGLDDHTHVRETARRARLSVVDSGRYSYRRFVRETEKWLLPWTVRWPFARGNSRLQQKRIAEAITRNEEIHAFAKHEAEVLFADRVAYEHSQEPEWVEERRLAAQIAARTGIQLDPD
jgi:hypothetical protein